MIHITVKVALKDFNYVDGTSNLDTANVAVFQMLPEGDGVNGAVIHIADLYTGNPSFDFVPPAKPQSVTAIPVNI